MTPTEHSPNTISKQLHKDSDKQELREKRSLIVFYSAPCSRTSYHARKDWVLYRINLFTWVQVEFQQKNNLALKDILGPQIALLFSAWTRYDICYLNYLVSDILWCKYILTWNKKQWVIIIKISEMNRTMIVISAI